MLASASKEDSFDREATQILHSAGHTELRPLGRGMQGRVYSAYDSHRMAYVAIKIVRLPKNLEQAAQLERRFIQEYMVLSSERFYPFLLTPYYARVGYTNDVKYRWFTMELCNDSLSSRTLASMELRQRLEICAQLLTGLGFLHRLGISHRDIKPSNLLISRNGRLKIGDFGIAHVPHVSTSMPYIPYRIGTPFYMAPELWSPATDSGTSSSVSKDSEDVWQRADQYASGLTIYQILTNRLPAQLLRASQSKMPNIDERSFERIGKVHLSNELTPLCVNIPDTSRRDCRRLCAVLNQMIAFRPGNRFSDIPSAQASFVAALSHDGLL